jgi:acyl CoA:acetate/3-ketoacid CoA transferase
MEVIDKIASTLKMDRDVLAKASIKVFLERELRCIEAEIFEIGSRYGVRSIFELDDKLKKGEFGRDNKMS